MKTIKFFLMVTVVISFQTTLSQSNGQPTARIVDPVTNCSYRYYYYPNLEAYFDTKTNLYFYMQKGEWIKAAEIPSGYRGYSIYNKVNVVINDYDDDNPTQFLKEHKKKYPYNSHSRREVASAHGK